MFKDIPHGVFRVRVGLGTELLTVLVTEVASTEKAMGAIWLGIWLGGRRKKLSHKKRQNKAVPQSQVSNKDPGL